MLNNRVESGPVGAVKVIGNADDYSPKEEPKAVGPVGKVKVVGKAEEFEQKPQQTSPSPSRRMLDLLRGDVVDPQTGESFGLEGFRKSLYVPSGKKSGLTIGTGVDLAQWASKDLLEAGVPEDIVQKVEPFLGKNDKSLAGKSPLTKQEIETLDEKVLGSTLGKLETEVPAFNTLPESLQLALVAAKHQYGDGAPELMNQVKSGDLVGATLNLITWQDNTDKVGETIAKKYRALGKKVLQELVDTKQGKANE